MDKIKIQVDGKGITPRIGLKVSGTIGTAGSGFMLRKTAQRPGFCWFLTFEKSKKKKKKKENLGGMDNKENSDQKLA